jgi:hypothetical protein
MIKVLRQSFISGALSSRYFGLRRPKDNRSINIKEFLKPKLSQPTEAKTATPEEKKTADIVKKKEEMDEMKKIINMIYPTYGWTDLDSMSSFSIYDHTMNRPFYTSKEIEKKLLDLDTKYPIDKTKEARVSFIPSLRALAIYAKLEQNQLSDKSSTLVFKSDFKPGERVPIPDPFPLDFTESVIKFNRLNTAYALKSLMLSFFDIAKDLEKKAIEPIKDEEPEDAYPPSIFPYFNTLPLWARRNQGIRNAVIGLEFYEPDKEMWKKEQTLNMLMRVFTNITDKDRMMALAAYDRTKTQLSQEKVLSMVKKYGLYPVCSDPKKQKMTEKFADYTVLLVLYIRTLIKRKI